MNPDRLFNYLDGKLSADERRALEEELMNDPEARREFEVARRIHSATQGKRERLEVLDVGPVNPPPGKRPARQILMATVFLVAVNVVGGLLFIARHEAKNPNRALLEQQNRREIQQAVEQAAAHALTPPPLGVAEGSVTAERGRGATVVDEIAQLTTRLKGTATKGIPDNGRTEVLVRLAEGRAAEFQNALSNLDGVKSAAIAVSQAGNATEEISIVMQVTEAK